MYLTSLFKNYYPCFFVLTFKIITLFFLLPPPLPLGPFRVMQGWMFLNGFWQLPQAQALLTSVSPVSKLQQLSTVGFN